MNPEQTTVPCRRPGVLLLHGLTGMPSEMRPVARHLTSLGYAVETPLLPGHGGSHRDLLRTTWREWLNGAREALRRIAGQTEPVVVAGLSMAALLAVLLAAEGECAALTSGVVLLT